MYCIITIFTFFSNYRFFKYTFSLAVPPLEFFRGAALAISGSIASKCVESHELGKKSMYNNYM